MREGDSEHNDSNPNPRWRERECVKVSNKEIFGGELKTPQPRLRKRIRRAGGTDLHTKNTLNFGKRGNIIRRKNGKIGIFAMFFAKTPRIKTKSPRRLMTPILQVKPGNLNSRDPKRKKEGVVIGA